MNAVDPFLSTKNQILRQKYQYMMHYLGETEARVNDLRNNNRTLRARIDSLQRQNYSPHNERAEMETLLRGYREEERDKTRRIDQLKKIISEYKYLCQEAVKLKPPRNCESREGLVESGRENSFFSQLESSENQNLTNVSSVSRNKSYQKVKTKIYCQKCENQYQPNHYYRHLEQCQVGDSLSKSKSKGEHPHSRSGYRTMRN